jgi:hypothetical protein
MVRRFIGLLLVMVMCFVGSALVAAAELSVADEEARLVTGMEVEVSSLHHRLNIGEHIIDGDLTTSAQRWISQLADKEPWLMLMLPEAVSVDTLVLYSGMSAKPGDQYNADTFVIEAMQGSDWVQVTRVEGNLEYRCVATFPAVSANAWRIRFIKSGNTIDPTDNRARIFEVRLLKAK